MTTQEFSNSIDTLLNSYSIPAEFGDTSSKYDIVLDEYEKSMFLTQAQDIIVKTYFDGTVTGLGADDSIRRQIDFSNLITVYKTSTTKDPDSYDDRAVIANLPSNLLFMLNEKLTVTSGGLSKLYVVKPISYEEFDRNMAKAYAQPLKKQCWRLFEDGNTTGLKAEIIPIDGVLAAGDSAEYKIRYIRRPKPIIVADLSATGLDIDGENGISECELHPVIHSDILMKAIELILSTRQRYQQPTQQKQSNQ